MQHLEKTVKLRGLGQGSTTSTELLRHENICLYKRSDDIYEVFIPNTLKEGEVFGTHYLERESYPSNEDFGKTAWCYSTDEAAKNKFNQLVDQSS